MKKKSSSLSYGVFLILAIGIYAVFSLDLFSGVASGFRYGIGWLGVTIGTIRIAGGSDLSEIDRLKNENTELKEKLSAHATLLKENKALKDQFETVYPKHITLIPARIVGFRNLLPHITTPSIIVIDKGKKDGIQPGHAVVVKNVLVGLVDKTSDYLSEVRLISDDSFSLPVKTISDDSSRKEAMGVLKGKGNGEMIIGAVLLSEDIRKKDLVLTKGDINLSGIGTPADLLVGIIVSIEKEPSALFQNARIKSPIDITSVSTVFIIAEYLQK